MNIDYVYSLDHFVGAGETLSSLKMEIFPGGKGLNQSVALARGESAEFALDIAAKASAVAVSRMGASSSIPTYAEVCG